MNVQPPAPSSEPSPGNSLEFGPEKQKIPITNSAATILAILGAIAALFFASTVLLQLVFSFFLFFLLNPIVEWAGTKRISRKVSSIAIVLLALLLTGVTVWGSYGAISSLAEEIPQYTTKIKKTIKLLQGQADEIQKNTADVMPQNGSPGHIQKVEVVEQLGGGTDQAVLHGVGSVFELLAAAFLVPILVLFLLLEKPHLKSAVFQAVPPSFRAGYVGKELSEMITGFFFGNIVVGLGTAAGFYALFTYLHLDNRLLLALLAGFVNLIPMVGAVLGGLFPMLQAFLQFDTVSPAVTIFASSIFLHFFVANFIIPKIVGSRINVNATSATIGLIFWGWLWGPLGLLLAVPLTATIRILLSARKSTEHLGRLIQEDSAGEMTRMNFLIQAAQKKNSIITESK
jgi:AI-2 transport protein TqsA